MNIYVGADHAGYKLKEELKSYLAQLGCEVEDLGAHSLDEDDDYPDFIIPAAEKVAQNAGSMGIVIGRWGHGEAITANKVKGVRAALCWNEDSARKGREHNNANVLALGAGYFDSQTAKNLVKIFLETPFTGQKRHKRRLQKIAKYETKISGWSG